MGTVRCGGHVATEHGWRPVDLIDDEPEAESAPAQPQPHADGSISATELRGLQRESVTMDAPAADLEVEPQPIDGDVYPVERGGNWWQLSDGSKVQGSREDAEAAEDDLHEESDDG